MRPPKDELDCVYCEGFSVIHRSMTAEVQHTDPSKCIGFCYMRMSTRYKSTLQSCEFLRMFVQAIRYTQKRFASNNRRLSTPACSVSGYSMYDHMRNMLRRHMCTCEGHFERDYRDLLNSRAAHTHTAAITVWHMLLNRRCISDIRLRKVRYCSSCLNPAIPQLLSSDPCDHPLAGVHMCSQVSESCVFTHTSWTSSFVYCVPVMTFTYATGFWRLSYPVAVMTGP